MGQSSCVTIYYVLELVSWNQATVRKDNFQCAATGKAVLSRVLGGHMDGKFLRGAGVSKDQLCAILQEFGVW